MNKIVLFGRFTEAPKLKKSGSMQTYYTNFNFACPNYDKKQEKEDRVDFFRCTAFEEKAKHICHYCVDGMSAVIWGTVQVKNYKDNSGHFMHSWEIRVLDIEFGYNPKFDGTNKTAELEEFADSDDIF